MIRKLSLAVLFALLPALALAQQIPQTGTINTASAGQGNCVSYRAQNNSTVGIIVTGTWTGTITPTMDIFPARSINKKVQPVDGSTAQATIVANGGYIANVGGFSEFKLCATAWTSGAAVVDIFATPAPNNSTIAAGSSGTVTAVNGTANQISSTGGASPTLALTSPLIPPGDVELNTANQIDWLLTGSPNAGLASDAAPNTVDVGSGGGQGDTSGTLQATTFISKGATAGAHSFQPGSGSCPTAAATIFIICNNGGTGFFQVSENGGSYGPLPVSSLGGANKANTILNADFAQVWQSALTTAGKFGFTFGESTAGTATGNAVLLDIQTLATSTVHPFQVTAGGTANGWRINTAGLFLPLGSGDIATGHTAHTLAINEGTSPIAATAVGATNAPIIGQTGADPIYSTILWLASLTSGGVTCGTSTTQLASSALLTANAIMLGGGAGVCPSTTVDYNVSAGQIIAGSAGGNPGSFKANGSTSGSWALSCSPTTTCTGGTTTAPFTFGRVTAGTAGTTTGFTDLGAGVTTAAMTGQTTATCTNVTGMTWNISANKNYILSCRVPRTLAASATLQYCLGGPGTATSYSLDVQGANGASGVWADLNTLAQTAYGTKTTASSAAANTAIDDIYAFIQNGATASGTALTLQTAANGTNTITVLANASCILTQQN